MHDVYKNAYMDLTVQPCSIEDVGLLDFHLPMSGNHFERLAQQMRGEVTYLVGKSGSSPVGNVLIRWSGSVHDHVRSTHSEVPEISRLFIHPELRGMGLGALMLEHAEKAIGESGYTQCGLAVGVDNNPALSLYDSTGYRSSNLIADFESDKGLDENGIPLQRMVTYLVKDLQLVQAH